MTRSRSKLLRLVPTTRASEWKRSALLALVWLIGPVSLASLFAFKVAQTRAVLALPELGAIPSFTMRDQAAAIVTDRDFRGRVSIVDFFFTSCPVMCPRLAARMAELRDRLVAQQRSSDRHIQLVSISVDPETDTPERLREYAGRFKAERSSWSFLTGAADDLPRIVVEGFKTQYEKPNSTLGIVEIMHGNWFILVDGSGKIRGYYLADLPADIERLLLDARTLAN